MKLEVMMEIVEEKIEFAPVTEIEMVAVVAATMLQTIKLLPEELKFFAPLETLEAIETVEAALVFQQVPHPALLMKVFLEMPECFTSFMTPPSKLVEAFQQFIEEEEQE